MIDNISIVILTCSNFSDMWSNHIKQLNKYWPNHPDYYFISDGNGRFDVEIPHNLIVVDGNMSDRLIEGLGHVSTDYVYLTFDDYYLNDNLDETKFDSILDNIISSNYDYCGFHRNFKKRTNKKTNEGYIAKLPLNDVYEINFYMSIWKKSSLLKCLKNGEDIWKAETRLTRRARENNLIAFGSQEDIVSFKDIVRKGKYLRSAYRYLKKNGLFISNRKKRTLLETVGLEIKIFVSRHSPRFLKGFLKKIYRKSGKTIYSDYAESDD